MIQKDSIDLGFVVVYQLSMRSDQPSEDSWLRRYICSQNMSCTEWGKIIVARSFFRVIFALDVMLPF